MVAGRTPWSHDDDTLLRFTVSPELLRIGAFVSFAVLVVVAVVLTRAFADVPEQTVIALIFGYDNICIFFDYVPATYVVPTLWMFVAGFFLSYIFTFWLRSKLAMKRKLLSPVAYRTFSVLSAFEAFCTVYFIQVFVNPPYGPGGLTMHMTPFTLFIIEIWTMSLKSVWYFHVCEGWMTLAHKIVGWMHVAALGIVTVYKVLVQANASYASDHGGPESGFAWVTNSTTAQAVGGPLDKLWTVWAAVVIGLATWFVELKYGDRVELVMSNIAVTSEDVDKWGCFRKGVKVEPEEEPVKGESD